MSSAKHRISKRWGRTAELLLVTGALFFAFEVQAHAESPHIRSTVDTNRCAACHSVHAATGPLLLRSDTPGGVVTGVCLRCHDGSDSTASNIASGSVDSFGLPSGHALGGVGAGTARIAGCETCHDSHAASEDARMVPAKMVNGTAVSSAGPEMCLACHSSNEDWYGPGYPSTSEPSRDDTGYPVAGTWTGPNTYFSADNAHRLIPETTQTVGVSEPVGREQGDCRYCHGAHGGPNAYDGLVATYTVPTQSASASSPVDGSYAALCFECHSGTKPSGFATATVDIEQFAAGSAGAGHSIVTSGGALPVGAPLPCFECHNPHGSTRANASLLSDERGASLDTTSADKVRAFCFTCHTTNDTTEGWDSVAGTYTADASAGEVVGLPRDGGVLHLPNTPGHSRADTGSCYTCHGDNYSPGGYNVHNPDDGIDDGLAAQLLLDAVSVLPSSTIDATASIAATGSLDASASLDGTASLDASASATATGSVEATPSLLGTDTGLPPLLPVWPGETGIVLGVTGSMASRRRR